MRINNNIMALNTHRQLSINNTNTQKSLEKLSSGYRINRAGDDAAGLAISEKMRAQIRGLTMASKNAQDGISLIQTAEGGLAETHSILQRMRELAAQSANDTNVTIDRNEIQKEVDQLASEITRIAENTEFNTQTLLNGGITNIKFHIGANEGQNIELSINAMDAETLGVGGTEETTVTEYDVSAAIATDSIIDEVEFAEDALGSAVIDGAEITFKFEEDKEITPEVGATVTAPLDGTNDFTFSAGAANGAKGNITIMFAYDDTATDIATEWSGNTLTVTLTDDGDTDGDGKYTATDLQGYIQGATSGAPAGLNMTEFTVTGTTPFDAVTYWAVDPDIETGVSLAGGADAVTQDVVTVSNGVDSKDIAVTDTTVSSFTTGADSLFGGITINLKTGETVAALTDANDSITLAVTENEVTIPDTTGINVSTQETADAAITVINTAIESVSAERAKLGAMQNRLEHTINNLDASAENLQAAESRIRDVDMAKEMMEFTKQSILQQAATAMLAQANQAPQTVLQLLR